MIKISKILVIQTIYLIIGIYIYFIPEPLIPSIILLTIGLKNSINILPQLLVIPLIETLLVVDSGITITKLLVIFYSIYFLFLLFIKDDYYFPKEINTYFYFLIIVLTGTLIALNNSNIVTYAGGSGIIIKETLFASITKIFFVILLIKFLTSKGLHFILNSINIVSKIIPIIIILLPLYIQKYGISGSWFQVERLTMEGTDLNEISILTVSFWPYLFNNVLNGKTFQFKLLNILGILSIVIIIMFTLSRAGTLSLLFAIIITLYIYGKKYFKKLIVTIPIIILVFIILIYNKIINFNNIIYRFIKDSGSIERLTAKRYLFWINAISLFPQRPLLGFGSTTIASRYYNYINVGYGNVMHNTFIQVLFQNGLIGLLLFIKILFDSFKRIKYIIKNIKFEPTIALPFISLSILLFGSLSLSWLWRELIWFNIAIDYSIVMLINKNLKLNENIASDS